MTVTEEPLSANQFEMSNWGRSTKFAEVFSNRIELTLTTIRTIGNN